MNKKLAVIGLCLMFLLCLAPGMLFAEFVAEVGPDGTLAFEDGKKVALAGIQMDEEGISILRVLARKQDVRVEILTNVKSPDGGECGYIYLNTKSIKMPYRPTETAGKKEMMLNKFLIGLGAARVDEGQDFSQKKMFLEAQEEARGKGEGVWSYVGS